MATRGKLRDVTVPHDTARDIGRHATPWIIRTPTGLRFTFSRLWHTMSGK